MRVTIQMPCAVVPGASELGLLWPRARVLGMAQMMNVGGKCPGGQDVAEMFAGMGLDIRPVLGTVRVDVSRERITGYHYVLFEAEVPNENEIAKMAVHGLTLIERDGLDLDMRRTRR